MQIGNHRSIVQQLVAGALGVLVAAIALYFAVELLRTIWPALLMLALGIGVMLCAIGFRRRRSRGW